MRSKNPIAIKYPEIQYSNIAVSLSLGARFVDGVLRFAVSISGEPYRYIPENDEPPAEGETVTLIADRWGESTFSQSRATFTKLQKAIPTWLRA